MVASNSSEYIKSNLDSIPDVNGLRISYNQESKKYHIDHESGKSLPFALQGLQEAVDTKFAIAQAIQKQNSCMERKHLVASCKLYSEQDSMSNRYADLFIDDNAKFLVIGDSLVLRSEEIENGLRGKKKHLLPDSLFPFVGGIANFVNSINLEPKNTPSSNTPTQIASR